MISQQLSVKTRFPLRALCVLRGLKRRVMDKNGATLDNFGSTLDNFGTVWAHFGAVSDTFRHTNTPKINVFKSKTKKMKKYKKTFVSFVVKILCFSSKKVFFAVKINTIVQNDDCYKYRPLSAGKLKLKTPNNELRTYKKDKP